MHLKAHKGYYLRNRNMNEYLVIDDILTYITRTLFMEENSDGTRLN